MNITIISPAGSADKSKIALGVGYLTHEKFNIIADGYPLEEGRWTAGSVTQRVKQFESAWCNPKVDVVFAARGGFGCIHLLGLLDWSRLAKYKNVLCGHSDLTVLHLAFMQKGISYTVSGSMPAVELATDKVDALTKSSLMSSLSFKLPDLGSLLESAEVLKEGDCRGKLVPVTLSVLCSLLGTEYFPDLSGVILVLEDVNEEPYRLDAYLSQLHLSGVLQKIGGVVFADFTGCGSVEDLRYLFSNFSSFINGPVIYGLPFGHCLPRLSLPVGIEVEFFAGEKITIESLDDRI
jgi:muramoyltetrapeptide carboxypeptidase